MVGIGQDAGTFCEAVHYAVNRVTHARGRRCCLSADMEHCFYKQLTAFNKECDERMA
jgi:hypothetical protein